MARTASSPSRSNIPIAKTELLMRMSDLIVATGGAGMVKAAYSSGTPAYGVGVGNAVHVVDETADLDDAAQMIANAKTFDYATSCLADNSVAAHSSVYETLNEPLSRTRIAIHIGEAHDRICVGDIKVMADERHAEW